MTNRDEKVLRHIGLYRLSLRTIISRLFFAGKDPGNVLQPPFGCESRLLGQRPSR